MPPKSKASEPLAEAAPSLRPLGSLSLESAFLLLRGDPLTPVFPPPPNVTKPRDDTEPGTLWSYVVPERIPGPAKLVAVNREALEALAIDWSEAPSQDSPFTGIMTGQRIADGSTPFAQRYGGNQFGHFSVLGDGRVLTLGEVDVDGKGQRSELQLKGIGQTPYSRRGDGYASLTGCVREWIFSEVLYKLNIPVARTLSVYLTGKTIKRDHGPEPGAILSRAAPTFVRFGTIELLKFESRLQELKALVDFVAERHFRAELDDVSGWVSGTNKYGRILLKIAELNADMVAAWQAYFFCHGTINTDNLSVLGLTMDLSGPSGFADAADPFWTPNLSDPGGMYAFSEQPDAVRNGLRSLASCLSHLVVDRTGISPVERISTHFDLRFKKRYLELMRSRLGLFTQRSGDSELVDKLVTLLEDCRADPQIFFRQLCLFRAYIPPIRNSNLPEIPNYAEMLVRWHVSRADRRRRSPPDPEGIRKRTKEWFDAYTARVFRECEAWESLIEIERKRQEHMRRANPKYLPKGWVLDEVVASVESWAANALHKPDDDVEGLSGVMARLEVVTRHLRSGRMDVGGDKEEGCRELERAVRVLVGDMFGAFSEQLGHGGWREGEKELGQRWSGEVEDSKKVNMLCNCSS